MKNDMKSYKNDVPGKKFKMISQTNVIGKRVIHPLNPNLNKKYEYKSGKPKTSEPIFKIPIRYL